MLRVRCDGCDREHSFAPSGQGRACVFHGLRLLEGSLASPVATGVDPFGVFEEWEKTGRTEGQLSGKETLALLVPLSAEIDSEELDRFARSVPLRLKYTRVVTCELKETKASALKPVPRSRVCRRLRGWLGSLRAEAQWRRRGRGGGLRGTSGIARRGA